MHRKSSAEGSGSENTSDWLVRCSGEKNQFGIDIITFDMHSHASNGCLKEVPKKTHTNKLEAMLSIIKADFHSEREYFRGRW